MRPGGALRIAQLSDLHLVPAGLRLYGAVDTPGAVERALSRLAALEPRPDLLVLSGDLVNDGGVAEYRWLRTRLEACGLPWRAMPGNHDRRDALRTVFGDQGFAGGELCCQRFDMGAGTLLLLDSVIEGEEGGEVAAAQLAWLDAACPDDRPVLLFMHHPPFAIGVEAMDAIGCRGGERLAAWLATRPQVEAVLCGHVHRFAVSRFAGRPAITAPSPAHQIALDLRPGAPLAYTDEPGGLLFHLWTPGVSLLSHYLPVAAAPVHPYID